MPYWPSNDFHIAGPFQKNSSVNGIFFPQLAWMSFDVFDVTLNKLFEQTARLPVVRDAMVLMLRHCNDWFVTEWLVVYS